MSNFQTWLRRLNALLDALLGTKSSDGSRSRRRPSPREADPAPFQSKPSNQRRAASNRSSGTTSDSRNRVEDGSRIQVTYQPERDGQPDPGEVVWTWVPYEDDPNQGKDRPVVVIGYEGTDLAVVPLTSKSHPERTDTIAIGAGSWDPQRRPSYAKLEHIMRTRPDAVRREGSTLDKATFEDLIGALKSQHGWPLRTDSVAGTR